MATTTILDQSNIQQAKAAVDTYRTTCTQLHNTLTTTINELRASSFIGDASNGFEAFYAEMEPALSSNLYGPEASVTAMLDQLLDAVSKALLGTVDPELGQANRNATKNTDNTATANISGGAAADIAGAVAGATAGVSAN